MNKKAISTVIATSLIILITVAAVAILWNAVIPMVSKASPVSDPCLGVTPVVEVVNPDLSAANAISFRLRVGDTEATISSVKVIIYNADGTSQKVDGTITGNLVKNEEKAVTVAGTYSTAQRIAVAPVVSDGDGVKECKASSIVNLA